MANKDSKQENDRNNETSSGQGKATGGSGKGGTATQRADEKSTASDAYKNETGDPGRTPGSAEGVENFEKTGNE
jgi:hypothetical protein